MAEINGVPTPSADGKSVLAYIQEQGFRPAHIAVELNGVILPKNAYDSTVISGSDKLEIVRFMGGG